MVVIVKGIMVSRSNGQNGHPSGSKGVKSFQLEVIHVVPLFSKEHNDNI